MAEMSDSEVATSRPNGKAVLGVLTTWRGRLVVDDAFASAVEAAGQSEPGLSEDLWHA